MLNALQKYLIKIKEILVPFFNLVKVKIGSFVNFIKSKIKK
jgi:hypothetical protein